MIYHKGEHLITLLRYRAYRAACSVVVKALALDLQGRWFVPWCGHSR